MDCSRSTGNVELFKCEDPLSKPMENVFSREQTFLCNWPNHMRAPYQDLAAAGFFYLGTFDRVQCFYCGGTLHNWHYRDEPWYEHAKWYPNCEYLLKMKGLEYVELVSSRYPDLPRPLPFVWKRLQIVMNSAHSHRTGGRRIGFKTSSSAVDGDQGPSQCVTKSQTVPNCKCQGAFKGETRDTRKKAGSDACDSQKSENWDLETTSTAGKAYQPSEKKSSNVENIETNTCPAPANCACLRDSNEGVSTPCESAHTSMKQNSLPQPNAVYVPVAGGKKLTCRKQTKQVLQPIPEETATPNPSETFAAGTNQDDVQQVKRTSNGSAAAATAICTAEHCQHLCGECVSAMKFCESCKRKVELVRMYYGSECSSRLKASSTSSQRFSESQ